MGPAHGSGWWAPGTADEDLVDAMTDGGACESPAGYVGPELNGSSGSAPISAKTQTFHRPVGPIAYDCVKVIIVRDGSATLFSEFGQRLVKLGDVVLLLCEHAVWERARGSHHGDDGPHRHRLPDRSGVLAACRAALRSTCRPRPGREDVSGARSDSPSRGGACGDADAVA